MTLIILIILAALALLWLMLWLSPAHRRTFGYVLSSGDGLPQAPLPPVVIIVPARNEGRALPHSIPTMCGQDYPNLKVILIDDQSDDDSPQIIEKLKREHANLIVIPGQPRPDGWCGKPWAVQQGVEKAKGIADLRLPNADLKDAEASSQSQIENRKSQIQDYWLLFTDADVLYHPQAVRQAMRLAQRDSLDLLSIFPFLTFSSVIERIGVTGLVTVLLLIFPSGWANNPRRKLALAAGAFMLTRRGPYEKLGEHRSVRSHIIEDVNLARKLKASGAKVQTWMTADLIQTEMYHDFRDMWEGLAKNAYAGIEYRPLRFWGGLLGGVIAAVFPPVYLVMTLVWAWRIGSTESWIAVILAAAINLLMILVHARAVRFLRLPILDTIMLPFSAGLYSLIALSSMWQHHFGGGNLWKGRRYDRKMLLDSVEAEPAGTSQSPVSHSQS